MQEASLTLIRAFGTPNTLIDVQLASFGLSRPRLHVLAFLNRAGNEVRMTDIGRWLGINKSNVTRMVDGLVVRSASVLDRRTILVSITSSGRKRLETALPYHLEHLSRLFGGLSQDQNSMLIHLLARAREAMLSASDDRFRGWKAALLVARRARR